MTSALLLGHLVVTWYLVGLCWLVQRVQYPLMSRVGADAFVEYERGHVARITPVVAPPMLFELASGVALVVVSPTLLSSPAFALTLLLLALVWGSTFGIQVPLHAKLEERFDARDHGALVRSNWIRTLAWSARGVLVAHVVWTRMTPGAG